MAGRQAYLEEFRLALADAEFKVEAESTPETWSGEVSVEWDVEASGRREQATHKVAIILPEAFPYVAPLVISKDDPPLSPSWHLNPEPRQSLCLWVPDAGWKPYFTAHKLLARVGEWFHHYHTREWPEDSQVPDLHRYLEKIGTVLLGEGWRPPQSSVTGRFAFWYSPKLSLVTPALAATEGESDAHAIEPEKRLTEPILYGSRDTKRFRGVWFRLPEPFVPPNNLRDLLAYIDSCLIQAAGWAREQIKNVVGEKSSDAGFPIGIGYQQKGEERWLFLWAHLSNIGEEKRFRWSSPANITGVRLKSFQTAPAKERDLLRRVEYLSRSLTTRKVTIFGVGALGSSVALLLAKSGVKELRLVDSQALLPGNVVRHVAGLGEVGFPKTIALKREILRHNPDCTIECLDASWERSKLEKYLEDRDLVIDTTANNNFSLFLNEVCLEQEMPFLVAAAYRRAVIGRIIIHTSQRDPCLACYENAAKDFSENSFPIIPRGPNEAFIEDGCAGVTEEAAALDIEAVANLTARVAIRYLQGNGRDSNLVILVNEPLPDVDNMLSVPGIHYRTNARIPSCSICENAGNEKDS